MAASQRRLLKLASLAPDGFVDDWHYSRRVAQEIAVESVVGK